ncbi:DNA-3-methyladenine glycosylase I [Microbulbifer sp. OS29]|uniref:DNA-3-methyladenine glycosylase I n=1 Tax=Microbulbifer okhotskensis TaxID=2926617 RepID=A0A9X2EUX4_9GAMM|nr:DNA-3-methyladenine glycosylase I [Microbulbifer okhotskensis]MCO1336351.1 DNA-3-methyladenine glycosylase I [Microbulbifer okhotskensis]
MDGLESRLTRPKPAEQVRDIADNLWLSVASRAVFQAGFSWTVVGKKWPDIEKIFYGFDVSFCRCLPEEVLDDLMRQEGMIKHWTKTRSIQRNADFFWRLSNEYGSLGEYFASWNTARYVENLQYLRKGGDRLGGKTAQVFLRRLGVDTLIFPSDTVRALIREGVVDKSPSSKKEWAALQGAIEIWQSQSGRSLNEISQVLSFSVG